MNPVLIDEVIGEVADTLVSQRRRKGRRRSATRWQFSLRTFLACTLIAPIVAWIAFSVIPDRMRPLASIAVSKSIRHDKPGGRELLITFHPVGQGQESYVDYDPFDGNADVIICPGMTFGTQPGCAAPITPAMQQRYAAVRAAVRQRFDPDTLGFSDWRAKFSGDGKTPWPPSDTSFRISRMEEERLRLQRSDFPASAVPSGY